MSRNMNAALVSRSVHLYAAFASAAAIAGLVSIGIISPVKSEAQTFGSIYVSNSSGLQSWDSFNGASQGVSASFNGNGALAFDAAGNAFAMNSTQTALYKITTGGSLSTFATGVYPPGIGTDLNFDSTGKLWTIIGFSTGMGYYDTSGSFHNNSAFNSAFFTASLHNNIQTFAIDGSDNFVFADTDGTLSRYSQSGTSLGVFGATGLGGIIDLEADSSGNIYVSHIGSSHSILEYDASGSLIHTFATTLNNGNLAADNAGGVYNEQANKIEYISSGGTSTQIVNGTSNSHIVFRSSSVPEPGAIALGVGAFSLGGLALMRRRRHSRK